MRALIVLAALFFSGLAQAQVTRDSSVEQNTQGANTDVNALDPAAKARLRVEGAAGGTGAHVPPEASGGATVGNGSQHRHWPKPPPDSEQEQIHSEKPSDREEARGAQGTSR